MQQSLTISYLNLLLAISDAIDLASPRLSQHQIRTAYICWEMAKTVQLSQVDTDDLFVAALMHDIGALTPEEKCCLHQAEVREVEQHCVLGEKLLLAVPEYERIARIVRYHHTAFDDLEMMSDADALLAQLLHIADYIERLIDRERFILHQVEDITRQVQAFNDVSLQEILPIYQEVASREEFWLNIMSQRVDSLLLRNGPCQNRTIGLHELKTFATLFRNIIDFRSHFTATHSVGVAASAVALAKYAGMSAMEADLMGVAGSLHDLGKLAIPNSILTKPAKLTPDEFAIIRQHTYCTYSVLRSIGGIEQIAEWAAFHHERLDGHGYPFHIGANKISLGSRIMTVADILTALTEDRPYRAGMSQEQALAIIHRQVAAGALDAELVDVLQANYTDIVHVMHGKQQEAEKYYTHEFAVLELAFA